MEHTPGSEQEAARKRGQDIHTPRSELQYEHSKETSSCPLFGVSRIGKSLLTDRKMRKKLIEIVIKK